MLDEPRLEMGRRGCLKAASSLAAVSLLNASVLAIQVRGARLPDQVLVFSGVEAPPKN